MEMHDVIPSDSSAAGGAPPLPRAEVVRQLERITANAIFRKSDSLRHILTFLVEGLLDSPGTSFKEHEIATRALGRSDDFDPRLDSTVRVHTARLRTKLIEYYAGEGRCDAILFEIPKGTYQLTARPREAAAPSPAPPPAAAHSRARNVAVFVWACVASLAALVLGVYPLAGNRPRPPEPLRVFWSDFTGAGDQTTLVFSNSRFLSAPDGLQYLTGAPVAPELVNENYTGTGDVYAVSALSSLFAHYWRPVRIKRGRLLTWDDARQQNLIFVGGPNVNLQLGQLPEAQRFRFSRSAIEDARSGARYGNSGKPYTSDHAIVSLTRLGTGRSLMTLAGTTTLGTQAAVDFVTREDTAKTLLLALGSPPSGSMVEFEALLRTRITDGVPVESRIVAVHLRK